MISKVQGKTLGNEAIIALHPKLTPMERGMLAWVVLDPGDRVLDVSAGDGLVLEYLHRNMECEICGTSANMEHVKRSRTRLQNADIVYAQPEDIPWRENAFDAVMVRRDGQGEESWPKILAEVLRVLRPGGQFVLGANCYPTPLRQIANLLIVEQEAETRQLYESKASVLAAVEGAGFEQVTWQQVDLITGVAIGWKPIVVA